MTHSAQPTGSDRPADAAQPSGTARPTGRRTAGAFDIRTIIGSLLGIYGVVILVVGLVDTSQAELDRAGGANVNLYTGIGLVIVAVAFLLWARLRPTVVAEPPSEPDPGAAHAGPADRDA